MKPHRATRIFKKARSGARISLPGSLQVLKQANQKLRQKILKQDQKLQTLQNSERFLSEYAKDWQKTFDSVSDAVWLLDLDHRILRCNKATKRLFGKGSKEILGRHCCEVVHGTRKPPKECPVFRMRKTLRRESSVIQVGKKWFSVTVDPILNAAGALSRVAHIIRDITDQKEAELSLLDSESKYRSLFEGSKDAMMTLEPPSWKFSSANQSMVEMFRSKNKAELLRRSPWELSPKRQPDGSLSARKARQMIQTAMRKGSHFFEWIHQRLDGAAFLAEVLLTRVEREGNALLQATVRDITERKRYEEEIQKNSQRFQAIFNSTVQFIALLDSDGTVLEVNQSALNFGGLTLKDVRGKFFYNCCWWTISKRTQKKLKENIAEAARGKLVRYPVDVLGKNGVVITIDFSLKPVKDKQGKVVLITAEGRDITENQRAKKMSDRSQAYFKAIIENLPGLAWLKDQNGKFLAVNQRFADAARFSDPQKLSGKTDFDIWPEKLARKYVNDDRRVMRTGRSFSGEEVVSVRGISKWYETFKMPVRDAQGRILGTSGYSRDITERKYAEDELRSSEARFRSYFETPLIGVAVTSPQKGWVEVNDRLCSLLGYSRKELLCRTWAEMTHPDDLAADLKKFDLMLAGKIDHYVIDKRFIRKNGDIVWINLAVGCVRKPNRRVDYVVALLQDISERKRAEEQLRENTGRLSALSENLADGMVYQLESDLAGIERKFTFISPAVQRMHGAREEKVLKDPSVIYDQVAPEDRALLAKKEARAAQKMRTLEFESKIKLPSGKIRWRRFVSSPRKSSDGKSLLWDGIEFDITEHKRAVERLEAASARIHYLSKYSNDIIILLDDRFRFVETNERAEDVYGYTRKELIGMHATQFRAPETKAAFAKQMRSAQNTGKALYETLHQTKGGRKFPVEISIRSFKVGSKNFYQAVIRDISERKRIERELKETKERLEYVLGATKTGVDIIDKDFNLRYVDPAWKRRYGNYKGRKCYKYFMGRNTVCPGCGIPKAFKTHKTTITEEVLVRENGRVIEVHTIPFKDEKGEWLVAEFNLDITERKRIMKALDENRRQLREIIDTVPHMIFAKDAQGRFLLVNEAVGRMYNKKPSELIGTKRKNIHPVPKEAAGYLKMDREVLASGKPRLIAHEPFTDVRGQKHILETIKIPFKMAGSDKKTILGVSVDMTEQKKIEDFRNDVIRTISHELRTPLSIEKGGVSLILDGLAGEISAKQRELLEMVLGNIERLSRLIDDLLNISRIESRKLKIFRKSEDFRNIVRDTVFEYKNKALAQNLELKLNLPEKSAVVYADKDKIAHVLGNLIDNALKFTNKGFVEVSVDLFEHEVECSVRDTGIGMSADQTARAFEKFHQFSRIPGAGEKGLGLGLSISRGFIEAHGGKIWVRSQPGKGTCVTFSLPYKKSGQDFSKKGS